MPITKVNSSSVNPLPDRDLSLPRQKKICAWPSAEASTGRVMVNKTPSPARAPPAIEPVSNTTVTVVLNHLLSVLLLVYC
jgi:hypothetical protein